LNIFQGDAQPIGKQIKTKEGKKQLLQPHRLAGHVKAPEKDKTAKEHHMHDLVEIGKKKSLLARDIVSGDTHRNNDKKGPDDGDI